MNTTVTNLFSRQPEFSHITPLPLLPLLKCEPTKQSGWLARLLRTYQSRFLSQQLMLGGYWMHPIKAICSTMGVAVDGASDTKKQQVDITLKYC